MPAGSVLADRYVIAQEIGRGGMGVVFEAFDSNLERPVAVKLLNAEFLDNREAVQRFQREALAASKLGHPNICNVFDRGTSKQDVPYIIMELLKGESLAERLQREVQIQHEQVVAIALQTLSALAAVHRKGIVHRDLKPENIFIARDDVGDEQVKLVDFGISKHVGELIVNKLTRGGIVMGTPYYISPEATEGRSELIDHRTDIWAVGVIMYEALTGNPPFIGESYLEILGNIQQQPAVHPRQLVPSIPEGLAAAILQALEKDPRRRYNDAAEFTAALMDFLGIEADSSVQIRSFGLDKVRPLLAPPSLLVVGVDGEPQQPRRVKEVSDYAPTAAWEGKKPARQKSKRLPLPLWLMVGAAVILLGGLFGYLTVHLAGQGDAQDQPGEPAPPEEPVAAPPPEKSPPEPVAPQEREPQRPPDPPAEEINDGPAMISVTLEGVPSDATVVFNGLPIEGHVVRGAMGSQGVLVITRPNRPSQRFDLPFQVGMPTYNVGVFFVDSPDSPPQGDATPR